MLGIYEEIKTHISTSKLFNSIVIAMLCVTITTVIVSGLCLKNYSNDCVYLLIFGAISLLFILLVMSIYLRYYCYDIKSIKDEPEPEKITVLVDNPLLDTTPPSPKKSKSKSKSKSKPNTDLIENPMLTK